MPPNSFYKVLNAKGEQFFFAAEMRGGVCGACARQLCGSLRNFDMTLTGESKAHWFWTVELFQIWTIVKDHLILDTSGCEVARFDRPFKCTCCYCMPCCLQIMEVTTSSLTIGHIKQKCHCYPVFQVCDSNENTALEIKGPVCPISCFGNVDFEVILHPVDASGSCRSC